MGYSFNDLHEMHDNREESFDQAEYKHMTEEDLFSVYDKIIEEAMHPNDLNNSIVIEYANDLNIQIDSYVASMIITSIKRKFLGANLEEAKNLLLKKYRYYRGEE